MESTPFPGISDTARAGRVDPADIQEAQSLLFEAINKRLRLIKVRHEYKGLCPFHAEKTPSFKIDTRKGFFHCHGCGAHGDAIDFVKRHDGLDFKDAVSAILGRSFEVDQNTAEQRAMRAAEAAALRRQADQDQADAYAAVASKAHAAWAQMHPARADHPYLTTKNVGPEGLWQTTAHELKALIGYVPKNGDTPLLGSILVAPIRNGPGKAGVTSLEFIDQDGRKSALAGGRKAGCYWVPERLPDGDGEGLTIAIGEGIATIKTIIRLTGWLGAAAFGRSNLEAVAKLMRGRFPAARLVVCADRGNGEADAAEAAEAVAGDLLVPAFPAGAVGTDFNDLAGVDTALAQGQLLGGEAPPEPAPQSPKKSKDAQRRDRQIERGWQRQHYRGPSALGPYYSKAAEDRAVALARQERLILNHVQAESARAAARKWAANTATSRQAAAAAAAGRDLTAGEKGRITKATVREAKEKFGVGSFVGVRISITGAQGTGKTSTALRALANPAIPHGLLIRLAVPTVDKAKEAAAAYQRLAVAGSLPVVVRYGRKKPDPEGDGKRRMCVFADHAEDVATSGGSVLKLMCSKCPEKNSCGDQRQRNAIKTMAEGRGGLVIEASNGLYSPTVYSFDMNLVDESFIQQAETARANLNPANIAMSRVRDGVARKDQNEIDHLDILRRVQQAVTSGLPILQAIREPVPDLDGWTVSIAELRRAASLLAADRDQMIELATSGQSFDPAAVTVTLKEINATQLPQVITLLQTLVDEYERPRSKANCVVYEPQAPIVIDGKTEYLPRIFIYRRHKLKSADRTSALIMDGTGDIWFQRKVFGSRVEHHHVAVERDAFVVGTVGKSYSNQSITGLRPKKDKDGKTKLVPVSEKSVADAAKLRRELITVLRREGGMPFLCASKKIVEVLGAEDGYQASAAWFGALRGMNRFEDCEVGFAIGREQPSIESFEERIRAWAIDDDEVFEPSGEWCWQSRGRRLRNGRTSYICVPVAADPRTQRLVEQGREGELCQGIDRTRPIFNHRRLFLLNALVLDTTYDKEWSHEELVAGGSRLERLWLKTGFMPTGRMAWRLAPELWSSEEWAGRECYDAFNCEFHPIEALIGWNSQLFSVRLEGQRGREALVFVDVSRHPDVRAALSAALDVAVVSCSPVPVRSPEVAETEAAVVAAAEAPPAEVVAMTATTAVTGFAAESLTDTIDFAVIDGGPVDQQVSSCYNTSIGRQRHE